MKFESIGAFAAPLARMTAIVFIVGAATTSTACDESCDVVSGLGEPYRAAIQNPETFDAWVAQHPNYFTDERVSCLVEKEQQAYQREIESLRQCDQLFAGDAVGLDFCRGSIENPEFFTAFWRAVLFAANGQGSFLATGIGQELNFIKQDDPAFYNTMVNEIFTQIGPALETAFQCKHCSRAWYQIF